MNEEETKPEEAATEPTPEPKTEEVRKNFPGHGGLTKDGLALLGVPELVELYNGVSEKKVKVFNKKPDAIERVWSVYPEWDGTNEFENTNKSEDTDMGKKNGDKKADKAKAEKKARGGAFPEGAKIKLLVDGNPKREGSASHKRFAKYSDGMLVATALEKGVKTADIHWDVKHNYIAIR